MLGWAGEHMRKLAVSLSDINGPRGGVDKRCKIHLQFDSGKQLVVEDTEADLYQAIHRASERAEQVLLRRMARQRGFRHTRMPAGMPFDARDEGLG